MFYPALGAVGSETESERVGGEQHLWLQKCTTETNGKRMSTLQKNTNNNKEPRERRSVFHRIQM